MSTCFTDSNSRCRSDFTGIIPFSPFNPAKSQTRMQRLNYQHSSTLAYHTPSGYTSLSLQNTRKEPFLVAKSDYPETIAPPLTWMLCPLMKLPSLLARKTYAGPSSEGSPILPIGAGLLCQVFISSLFIAPGWRGVQTGPGQTALTRIPFERSWLESALTMATCAPLVME